MKTYISTLIVVVLSTTMITNAQVRSLSPRNNWITYPAAKAQKGSTFSEMLPTKPLSKTYGISLQTITNSKIQSGFPEVPPSKKNYAIKHQPAANSISSLPKKPGPKTNAFLTTENDRTN